MKREHIAYFFYACYDRESERRWAMNLFYEQLALSTASEEDALDIISLLGEELCPNCRTDLRDLWEGMNNGANIFVARDRDLPRRNGFLIVGMGIVTFKWQPGRWSAYIDDIATRASHRGNGIATEIMNRIEALIRDEEVELVRLTTRRPAARRLYENKLGYVVPATTLLQKKISPVSPDDEPDLTPAA